IDLIHAIVTHSCLVFASVTVVVNFLLLIVIYLGRSMQYTRNFFYVIYMVGFAIDIVAMLGNHVGSLFPSRSWFLSMYLFSTFPGRIWSNRGIRFLTIAVQISIGVVVGGFACTQDVYWVKAGSGGWYIQIIYYATYAYGFITESNFEV
ncbi:hypothetical protein PFISCL1PPCAC_14121, partial [Pristionchus fissidentatus]